MILHHSGFIVRDIDLWEKNMVFQEKINDVIDPIQNARLALYKNYGDSFIELIQPLNEQSFTWSSLNKFGEHFNHFCYAVESSKEMKNIVSKFALIHALAPVEAVLFNGKKVAFFYARNRQIVEFLINE